MATDLQWALVMFVVVTLFTPGPNNTMLMTSGLNFGFRRGLPHLWGVTLGFAFMVLAVGDVSKQAYVSHADLNIPRVLDLAVVVVNLIQARLFGVFNVDDC